MDPKDLCLFANAWTLGPNFTMAQICKYPGVSIFYWICDHICVIPVSNWLSPEKSTSEVLLANLDDTYEFIEKMISAASSPFRSKRIHIGMDEVVF